MDYDLISVDVHTSTNKNKPIKLVEGGNVIVPLVEAVRSIWDAVAHS